VAPQLVALLWRASSRSRSSQKPGTRRQDQLNWMHPRNRFRMMIVRAPLMVAIILGLATWHVPASALVSTSPRFLASSMPGASDRISLFGTPVGVSGGVDYRSGECPRVLYGGLRSTIRGGGDLRMGWRCIGKRNSRERGVVGPGAGAGAAR
ncbi:unnamed protein product, partial [Pylaiella littoralis]